MAKKFNIDTIKELKTSALIRSILFLIGAIVILAVGLMISKNGGTAAIIGLIVGLAGAGWMGYTSYKIVVDPKNAKTCNANFWNKYECISSPTGDDVEEELDTTECKALTKAEYGGYAGVWLKSNTSTNTSNVDAYYISGDVTSFTATPDRTTSGSRLFAKKGDSKTKEGELKVTGTYGCNAVTPPPSSPSSP